MKNPFKNTLTQQEIENSFWESAFASLGLGEYADIILKICFAPIFDELKKVEFFCAQPVYEEKTRDVINFLNANYDTIYKYLFKKGFVACKINQDDKIIFDNNAIIKTKNEFEKEIANPISAMSFDFNFFNKSTFNLLETLFLDTNTALTAQRAITKILGQFTIFSKDKQKDNERVVPLTDEERKNFVFKFNNLFTGKNVGTAVDFTNANLKRDTILFPLDKLQIQNQIIFNILLIAGVLNVPYDLIPLSGKSTYANQESAREYLRTNTVTGIAENMLELGKKILTAKSKFTPKTSIDFRFIDTLEVNQQPTNSTVQ